MSYNKGCLVAIVLAMSGCSSPSEPGKTPSPTAGASSENAASEPAGEVENSVRAIVAEQFGVEPSTIQMDKLLSEPPHKADDLDLVEIVMLLEERHGITIPDAALKPYSGTPGKIAPVRITPNQLATVVKEALKTQTAEQKESEDETESPQKP